MTTTIQLTDEQAKALCEGNAITIQPPQQTFSCRKTNSYGAKFSGVVDKYVVTEDQIANYAYQATRAEAEEFETLRRNLAIQFEFTKQHDPYFRFVLEKDACYISFDVESRKWVYCISSFFCVPTVAYMPKAVAEKFCDMANKGLIEGLENPC